MKGAASKLFNTTSANHIENIIDVNGVKVAKVAVSVDGTWQRRGYNSKYGVVFTISVDTGEVLDAVVRSLYCHQCASKHHLLKEEDFQQWYREHQSQCQINHQGSSESMETSGAIEMFLQSIETRNLMYHIFFW